MPKFYVYVLYRLDGTPFYVGKGQGNRWLHHERDALQSQDTQKLRLIKSILDQGKRVAKQKLFETNDEAEAYRLEALIIHQIGIAPNGPLLNISKGEGGAVSLVRPPPFVKKRRVSATSAWLREQAPLTPPQLVKPDAQARRYDKAVKGRLARAAA